MIDTQKQVLGDDLPKINPWQEDRLGYAPFAKRIARVIIRTRAPNGYVIGLHGQWGSGKSTIINFILAYLDKHNVENENDQIIHVDFRPWIVSGHQDLVAAFFKVLSERLENKERDWKKKCRLIANGVDGSTDGLVDAAAKVALAIDPSGLTSRVVGDFAKKQIKKTLSNFLENPSLQAAYEELKKKLTKANRRFLVTIDDIDRLEATDVRVIMQMVKSIGGLPNVVYLLSYDRKVVWRALDHGGDGRPPYYAEKIVQQEVELPRPSKGVLLRILDEEIAFIFTSEEGSHFREYASRWHDILMDGVQRWIKSPRDIVRLANAIKFSWPAVEGEMDPQDLLTMEGLRLFDEGVFNWIRDNRDFLFAQGQFRFASDEIKMQTVENLNNRLHDDVRRRVVSLLVALFPQSAKWFKGNGFTGSETFSDVTKRRGIGSEAGYDTYFGLHPSADDIPRAVLRGILEELADKDSIANIIRGYLGKRNSRDELMISKLLDELQARFIGNRPAQPTYALLSALFRVGDEIIGVAWDGALFISPPRVQIAFLIGYMLDVWGKRKAGQQLITAFKEYDCPAFMADIYVDRGRELGVFATERDRDDRIDKADYDTLGAVLLAKIRAGASDGSLMKAPFYFNVARAWAVLDTPGTVKAWLSAGIESDPEFMTKVGLGLTSYSVSAKGRYYTMRDRPEPELYDLGLLVTAGEKHLQRGDLNNDQRSMIAEIVRGSKQILGGRSSEGTREGDE